MKFNPEQLSITDRSLHPFIDPDEIWGIFNHATPSKERIDQIISKSLNKERLTLAETATLLKADTPEYVSQIKEGARKLKDLIYGNRIVLFAPLYIGNHCSNNCNYCGFRASNKDTQRKTLSDEEIIKEVEALEAHGQKRLILVYGEHKDYSPEYIAHTVNLVYSVKKGNGEIRRVNINAAPQDMEGFKTIHEAGIGTYQIFQETYHPEEYKKYHLSGKKADYENRLVSLDRAMEAGIDDVGIGALFGLYDWRFEVLSLVRHTNHLEACFNVGPHTISFPRLKPASLVNLDEKYYVSDQEFTRLVAILRLAVPYTGLILTAREAPDIRREVMQYGVSQIDGGTKIEMGAYSKSLNEEQNLNNEQFRIGDSRSLDEVISELLDEGNLPSFCTACYRLGRTGEHFMEFSVPGFIKRYCTPNAILTLAEYLVDYGSADTYDKGWQVIEDNLQHLENSHQKKVGEIRNRLEKIRQGERDLYF